MFRSLPVRCRFVVSPIETALNAFASGQPLSAAIVSAFILNQQRKIESLNDYVFVHHLVASHSAMSEEVSSFLQTTRSVLSLSGISSKGLSVIVSVLANSGTDPECLKECITEIASRDEKELAPRVIARLCKGLATLKDNAVDDNVMAFMQSAVENLAVSDLKPIELLHILSAPIVPSSAVLERLTTMMPLMSDQDAHLALRVLKPLPGTEEIVAELKKKIVRSKPKRNKYFKLEEPLGLPEVPKAPHFEYVRKIDLR